MASIAARKNAEVELRKKWLPVCFNDSTFIWCLKISWYWFISGAGQSAKDYIDNGKLVPDNVMVELILNELHGLKSESWLLDGEFVLVICTLVGWFSIDSQTSMLNLRMRYTWQTWLNGKLGFNITWCPSLTFNFFHILIFKIVQSSGTKLHLAE